MAAELMLFLACSAIACGIALAWLPWMARAGSLYALHTLRDRLYELGKAFPACADTLTYRDMEFLLSYYIHVSRDRGREDVEALFEMSLANDDAGVASWRDPVYERELSQIYIGKTGSGVYLQIVQIFRLADKALLGRWLGQHPVVLIVALLSSWIVAIKLAIDRVFASPINPAKIMPRKVESVAEAAATRGASAPAHAVV